MIEIQRILCPIDFSDFSRRALDHGVAIARWYDATVTLLNVHTVVPVAPAAPEMMPVMMLTQEDREQLLATMRELAASTVGESVPTDVKLVEGSPAREIVEEAREMASDLIVMGTHGRSGFERFALGSVTEKVLRKAPCPVLSVPHSLADAVPVPRVYKRIVCAIDFSDCSMRALDYALSLAQEADACLTVMHVFDLEGALSADWREKLTPPSLLKELEAIEAERRDQLARAVPENARTYCEVETVMTSGTPYREILKVAEEKHAELIAIGVHGRSAADLLFFGSTTNHIVRQATCPVLTIRHG